MKHITSVAITTVFFILSTSFMPVRTGKTVKNKLMNPVMSTTIKLPEPDYESKISVEEALLNRRSIRDFVKDQALTLKQISQLFWSAYGITEPRSFPAFLRGGLRTAPSAGALYPLDLYLVAGRVEGLKPGIYKYISESHLLELIAEGDVRKGLANAALEQDFIADAPASIVISAIYSRMTQKYGNRGRERYVCMDLGHAAQNVYLQAYALGIGTCAVGAFTDKMVSMVMMFDDKEEPLYIMPIGKY